MPFDGTDQRQPLTATEKLQLERLQAGRHRIRHRYLWMQFNDTSWMIRQAFGRCATEALGAGIVVRDCVTLLADQLPARSTIVGFPFADVMRFNDDPRTTHADILKLFDRTIAALIERQ